MAINDSLNIVKMQIIIMLVSIMKVRSYSMKNNDFPKASKLCASDEYHYKQGIEKLVQDRLDDYLHERALDINVQCIGQGSVVLSGFVDVLRDKVEAEHVVEQLSEVNLVENNITIPMENQFSKKELEAQISSVLQNSRYSEYLTNVTPDVQGGVATLQGIVENDFYKQYAQDVAANGFNIDKVVNKIKIQETKRI